MKVLVKTNLSHRFGKEISINGVNVIFNKEGQAEVEENDADKIKVDPSLKIEDQSDTRKELDQMTVSELKDLCETSHLPVSEYNSLKKIDLVDYVLKNLNN